MRKSKLDKFIERNDEKNPVNYTVIDRASERLRQRESGHRKEKGFQWGSLSKILVPLCCVVIILVGVLVFRYSPKTSPAEDRAYCGTEEDQRNIQSVKNYNDERNISLKYFELPNVERKTIIYEDKENTKDKDVLLWQRTLLLDTFEEILLYVELQDNYIFDFLQDYNNLEQEREIKGKSVKYHTFFDKDQVLYCTRASLEIDGFTYKIEFLLENEEQWAVYLAEIL